MPKVVSNGVEIFYEVTGSGEPVVLSHELAGDYRSWAKQVRFFESSFRMVTYNARGYPPSDVPAKQSEYSLEQAVDDLRILLDHLDIPKAHLVGLSMGGSVSLNFAIKYPQRTKSLVIAGTGNGSDNPEEFRKHAENLAKLLESGDLEAMSSFTKNPNRLQLKRKDKAGWQKFANHFMEHSPLGTAHTLRGVLGCRPTIYSLETQLGSLKVPTLIMVGDEDMGCIKPSLFLKDCLPLSLLVIFPQSGHLLNLEEPEMFNSRVLDFITNNKEITNHDREKKHSIQCSQFAE